MIATRVGKTASTFKAERGLFAWLAQGEMGFLLMASPTLLEYFVNKRTADTVCAHHLIDIRAGLEVGVGGLALEFAVGLLAHQAALAGPVLAALLFDLAGEVGVEAFALRHRFDEAFHVVAQNVFFHLRAISCLAISQKIPH